MTKIILYVIGAGSIGFALLAPYGTDSLVLFQKYPEPAAELLKSCVEDTISEKDK